jgi:hypothetical protein
MPVKAAVMLERCAYAGGGTLPRKDFFTAAAILREHVLRESLVRVPILPLVLDLYKDELCLNVIPRRRAE